MLLQPRWLGDVLLCTPAIHALRQARPDARIDFLTEPAGVAALEGNPDLDGILDAGAGTRLPALLRRIRRARYDAVIDFRSTGSTALAAAASGAAIRIGTRGRGLRNAAYTHLLPRPGARVYMARQKLALLAPLGIDPAGADTSLRIAIGPAERARADRVWREAGFTRRQRIVAVSAVSRVAAKQWGAAHWAAVADRIAATASDIRILLTSGPAERAQAAAVARRMTTTPAWDYGATTVRELAALYQRCSLWIGNDGGPKHIAVAAGTPTLTVIRRGTGPVWNDVADDRQEFIEGWPLPEISAALLAPHALHLLPQP